MGRDRTHDDPTLPLTTDRLIAVIGSVVLGAATLTLLTVAAIDYIETHRGRHRR